MKKQGGKIQPYKCLDVGRRQRDEPAAGAAAPQQQQTRSLFDPNFERAACGVGFIVNINGQASRKVSIGWEKILGGTRRTRN